METKIKMFTAEWCAPFKLMKPLVNKLIEVGYPIEMHDVDTDSETASKYNIRSVPTMLVTQNDNVVESIVGAQELGDLVPRLNLYVEEKNLPEDFYEG